MRQRILVDPSQELEKLKTKTSEPLYRQTQLTAMVMTSCFRQTAVGSYCALFRYLIIYEISEFLGRSSVSIKSWLSL